MLLKWFDCALSQLESGKLRVSGSKLELLAVPGIVLKLGTKVLVVTAWLVYQKPTRNRDAS